MKAEADRNLAAAVQAQSDARKAKDDFIRNVDGQQTQVGSPTSKAVLTRRTALTKAVDKAMDTRKAAEVRVRESDSMLASAVAWVAREEAKLQAAGDTFAQAEPLMTELQKNLEAAAKKPADPNAASQAETDFTAYKAYMKALQFWDQVPGLPDSKVWHFHPLAFIDFFKKCHWLSKGELEAIFPDGIYPNDRVPNPEAAREKHRISLNRVMWKYGITAPARQIYFLGQGGHECTFLGEMHERGGPAYLSKYDFNGDLGNNTTGDGVLFKGRGMKQVTGRYNYMRYWVYRGWLPNSWMGKKWTLNQKEKKLPANEQEKIREKLSPPPEIRDPGPEALESLAFNAVDAGGWFWEAGANSHLSISHRFKEGPLLPDSAIDRISKDINPGEKDPVKLKARRESVFTVYDAIGDELLPKSAYWKKVIGK